MATVFVCSKCYEIVESKFLEKGEIYNHKSCGGQTEVPSKSLDKSYIEKLHQEQEKIKLKEQKKIEEKLKWTNRKLKLKKLKSREKELKNRTLTKKYDVLVLYKGLAFLLMFATTGFFIYALVQFGDAPKATRKVSENAMITSTVSYVITMFSLFCLTKMIDFLFDLDKKTNI